MTFNFINPTMAFENYMTMDVMYFLTFEYFMIFGVKDLMIVVILYFMTYMGFMGYGNFMTMDFMYSLTSEWLLTLGFWDFMNHIMDF